MYQTTCTCPVCGEVFDVVAHSTPEPNALATAMLVQPERRAHADKSPQCTQDERWYLGWNKQTTSVDGPSLTAEETKQVIDGFAPVTSPDKPTRGL